MWMPECTTSWTFTLLVHSSHTFIITHFQWRRSCKTVPSAFFFFFFSSFSSLETALVWACMGSSSSRPATPPPDHGSIRSSIAKKKHVKENTIAPFLRSISCGASSLWRKNSFTQESRTKGGDGQVMSSKCEERPRLPDQLRNIGEKSVEKNHSRFAETGVGDSGDSSIGTDSSSICTRFPFLHQRSSSRNLQRRGSQEYATLISQRHFAADGQSSSSGLSDLSVECCPREGSERNAFSSVGSSIRVEGISRDVLEVENQSNDEDLEGSYRPPQIGTGDALSVTDSSQSTALGHPLDDVGTLHVEALGLVAQTLDESSNVLRGEARRNSRRRLWEALTRATTRRRRFSPSTLLANEDTDGLSRVNHDWSLFDWRSNEQGPLADQSDSVVRRPQMDQRSWRSRPQVWALQHFSRSMEGNSGHARHCTFGRHPDGHCSCEAFVMTEEASTRASISRIVMLAEALFEVLDEIHRQSMALSRSTSLSLVSLPAPGAVVDAFGTRIHAKADNLSNGQDKSSECYICLTEYEEGDCIRVLPCCHEFHMLCVDKWLKEVYRVCPLCRGNVCDETVGIPQGEAA